MKRFLDRTLSYQGQALAMSSNAMFNLSARRKPLIRKILQTIDCAAGSMNTSPTYVQRTGLSRGRAPGAHSDWMSRFRGHGQSLAHAQHEPFGARG